MKRFARLIGTVAERAPTKSCEILRENIPLRDMSDCLLAVYEEVSQRALQRGILCGARSASEREEWKAAEDDLFVRISVDFEESGANLYALVSLPGCAGGELTVAVDECWLLISGYGEHGSRAHAAEASADDGGESADAGSSCYENSGEPEAIRSGKYWELRRSDRQSDSVSDSASDSASESANEGDHECASEFEGPGAPSDKQNPGRSDSGVRAPRPFCVVALSAKVDPGRSVAVLCNGLLAIRMGKASLDTVIPRVA
jgi:HSP20 family molecular chaperone IbpA